eukprot:1722076-Rhodomonas_salina.2
MKTLITVTPGAEAALVLALGGTSLIIMSPHNKSNAFILKSYPGTRVLAAESGHAEQSSLNAPHNAKQAGMSPHPAAVHRRRASPLGQPRRLHECSPMPSEPST